ncbi:hypothetical protein ACBY01_01385 [Sphingomonas sp. ac-8]|uniref:hypothetical protein n=1 Tax=Sphingomonas sp. ac-8 TaxID=3242977 RepID=UPI003A7F8B78
MAASATAEKKAVGQRSQQVANDPIGVPDIELSPEGKPQWVINYVPREDVTQKDAAGGNLRVSDGS